MQTTELKGYAIGYDEANGDAAFTAKVLQEELNKRTGLDFALVPSGEGSIELSIGRTKAPAPEGFAYDAADGMVAIEGYDRSGLIHGAGYLLREANWYKGGLSVQDASCRTHPRKKLRGSQVGYRNKTNAYVAWTKETYHQYIRDLALFGASAIEFLPPATDEEAGSPVMKYDALDMLQYTSAVAHEYGLEVWIWYPNMERNRTSHPIPKNGFLPETDDEAKCLNEDLRREDAMRDHDFSKVPYVDHILIPGGDPGGLEPEDLFAFSERVADILHKYHPKAGVWISAQVMKNSDDFKFRFYDEVAKRPAWLTGVCHAPWVSHTMKECRERTPMDLPIRSYPDICHLLCCQYPVHAWDPIWAITAGRECYNPRPRWHRQMHRLNKPYCIGNLAYSEGIADDVSKFIWLDADWDDSIPYMKTLQDYARMFISPQHAAEIASTIALFEDIYEGPAVSNQAVSEVYKQLHVLEDAMHAESYEAGYGADSYRFQMPRLMSTFYQYIQRRAIRDKAVFDGVFQGLDEASDMDAFAETIRTRLAETAVSPDEALKAELWALGDICWEKINWKLSTTRHFSPDYSRGGFLDTADIPLCNAWWLEANLKKLSGMATQAEKQTFLKQLRDCHTAGPGGKYISFGSPESMQYLRMEKTWWEEPEAITIPRIEQHVGMFGPDVNRETSPDIDKTTLERVSSILGYYHAPVKIEIDGLVPGAAYEVRVVYPMRFGWKGQKDIPSYITVDGERLAFLGCVEGDEWVYRYALPAGKVNAEGRVTLEAQKDVGPRGTGFTEVWMLLR